MTVEMPRIVAELSGNHGGELGQALALVDAAADAGVWGVKLQTYTPETMTLNRPEPPFLIDDPHSLWAGRTLYDLYQQARTPWEWHQALFDRCRERGVVGFSSPFDPTAVDFLEGLGCPVFKISSFELTDLPLIRHAARRRKPLVISTGMGTFAEVEAAVATAREAGAPSVTLLKCTSAYPTQSEDVHLRTLPVLAERFACPVGLSDHTPGIAVALGAIALGATMIEKHLTLSRSDGTIDGAFSLEPAELAQLVRDSQRVAQALGDVVEGPLPAEATSYTHRRTLWVVRPVAAGVAITADDIRALRPAGGLSPARWDAVIGRVVSVDLVPGQALLESHLG